MRKLALTLSRKILLTIYKSFVRPNLDYEDIIYDKLLDESFKSKLETIQYHAALLISGTFKGTCGDCLYKKLGFESLAQRRWSQKIFFFHGFEPSYLQSNPDNRTEPFHQIRSSG